MGIQMGAQGLLMKYSRGDESQADAPPELFSSHPNPGNRQEAIAKQIADWPPMTYVDNGQSFTQTRQRVRSPANGPR
jgi:predicted Zn-dependent protease